MDRAEQARRILLAVFLVWCLVLAGAFAQAVSNFTAVQNTQASVRAKPTDFAWTSNSTEVLFTIRISVENGGRLDIRVYEIPTQLYIFNQSTPDEWVEVGQANARTELVAGRSTDLTMKIKLSLDSKSPAVKEALKLIKPGVSGVKREWFVYGRVLFYVDPFGVRGEQQVCAGDPGPCVIYSTR